MDDVNQIPEDVLEVIRLTDVLSPTAIRAGATHRVFEAIAQGMPLGKIAAERQVDESILRLLVGFYEEVGLVRHATDETDPDRVELTSTGEIVAQAEPGLSLRGMLGHGVRSLVGMDHMLKTGEIATFGAFGEDFWTAMSREGNQADAIEAELNGAHAPHDDHLIFENVDWTGTESVADLGGGRGDVLLKILEKCPGARGFVLEFGDMAEVARRHIANLGLESQVTVIQGTFFEPLPVPVDVIVLSSILADWSDSDAVRILSACRASEAGRVILAEVSLRGNSRAEDLYYRSLIPHPVREVEELRSLATAAGFTSITVLAESPLRSVLELRSSP